MKRITRVSPWPVVSVLCLAFLAMPLLEFWTRPHGLADQTRLLGGLTVFAGAYLITFARERDADAAERQALVAWIVTLAVYLLTLDLIPNGSAVLLIFSGCLIGFQPRRSLLGLNVLATGALFHPVITGQFTPVALQWLIPLGLWLGLSSVLCHLGYRHRQAQRTQAAQDAARGAEAERQRIARDLHDLLGHQLSVLRIKVEVIDALLATPDLRVRQELRDLDQVARDALSELRALVQGYQGGNVQVELTRARWALGAAGVDFEVDAPALPLDAPTEHALALLIREAATNVVRHARASRMHLHLQQEGDTLVCRIHDDGLGGDLTPGQGLRGMQERAQLLGGTVTVTGEGGTHITVTLPTRPATLPL
ncbi:sensor histidine kinase [Deinococcus sedimenti]|uniref:Two-component sensor histidine kinase n=1 Tax=Deinococcus sedimenti TaxID=1867090 RepID=A0ABQ2SBV0_9DEIO|nr:sensor histidine kinase [Deinococcus sedimenti]GGS10049.1 two-component sensor histidine kinase [Deinococcus sedimenti]